VTGIGFVLNVEKPEAAQIARELVPWLVGRGCVVRVGMEHDGLIPGAHAVPEDELGGMVDILVVLGGDGTLLHGARVVGERKVPVLGINLGRLGFLVPFAPEDARAALEGALDGKWAIEERLRLRVKIVRDGKVIFERLSLNDAVISQGSIARLIELDATLDGQRITRYRADGLIIATPTGSTAYNLAAGGPILSPGQGSLAMTPICPHTLTNRPLVVPADSYIVLELGDASRGVMLTVDGQLGDEVLPGDRIEIAAAGAPLRLYRSGKSYFEILREKLSWGAR
jgi:NAD+ kinase